MTKLGLPFQGLLWYYLEPSYGGVIAEPVADILPISTKVLVARPGIGDRHKELRGIDSPLACHLLEQVKDYTFHLEYVPQLGDTLMAQCINRTATCGINSFVFELTTNKCETEPADKTFYSLSGCVPKTIRISSSHNNEYITTIDFSAQDNDDALIGALGDVTPIVGALLQFNKAGAIQKDAADVAYILNSVDLTIEQDIKDYWDHDTTEKQYAIPGEMSVSGSVDISLDDGGGTHLTEVVACTAFSLVIDMGDVGAPRITLPGCQWKSSEINKDTSGEAMMESAPFTGKPTDSTAIMSTVPA